MFRLVKSTVKCVKASSRCYTGISRQIYGLIIKGVMKFTKKTFFGKTANPESKFECTFIEEIKKHLIHIETIKEIRCFNDPVVSALQKCLFTSSSQMQFLNENVSDSEIFPNLCCSVRELNKCLLVSVRNNCEDTAAKKDGVVFVQDVYDSLLGDALDFVCAKQSSLEICEKNHPLIMASIRNVEYEKYYKKTEFLIQPVLRLVNRLAAK